MATQTGLTGKRAKGLAEFRLIPRIETYPAIVSFAQTPLGKGALLAVFGLGVRYFFPDLPSLLTLLLPLALITFFPEYRRFVLAISPIAIVFMQAGSDPVLLGLTLVVIAIGILLYWCAMCWPHSRFGQRPVAFLLTGFTVLIVLAGFAAPQSLPAMILWGLVGVLSSYVWFIAYALTDRNTKPVQELTLELTAFRPLWGSTATPFPKGAAYLRRIEAKSPEQLAVVQLKGLKLLAWAILLAVLQGLWQRFFHGYLRIPTAEQALAMSVHRTPVAWHLCWESLILAFFELVLSISVMGHRIIACCRLAGFNALRNTYRPLSSTTIMEFFNRFYYYFKELLVDLFFYPAFLRYWKGHKRLRMIFATFAAAFFGNGFYHFTRDWQIIQHLGLWKALLNYQTMIFYNAALTAGLCFSQARQRKPKTAGLFRGHIVPVFGVIVFYCLLSVFEISERMYPLVEHLRFFASLFFIHV
ncbi:MAG TPA: hypothetical protein VGG45_07145 [Terracidiphilus sp.]|jgi:hypothetical protein